MSNTVLQQYETCDAIAKTLLRCSPIWSKSTTEYYLKTFLQYYTSIFGTLVSYAIFDKAFNASDMGTMTECLVPAIALFIIPFKLMSTVVYRETFIKVYQKLDESFRHYCYNDITMPMEKGTLKLFNLSMKFLLLCCKLLLLNYTIMPLIFIIYQIVANVRPVLLILPYPATYPDRLTSDVMLFTVVYIMESINAIIGASTSLGVDCFFGLVVFQMTGILRAVSHKVFITQLDTDYIGVLREFIVNHCQLLHYSHKLEPIYGMMILSQRITDALVLCAVIFQMHQIADLDMSRLIMYCSWVLLKFIQQLTYGWYGSLLISESEKLRVTIYSSKWPDFYNKESMRYVTNILQQKPIQIKSYGFFVIAIPMASSVITTSFSYFFLLQSLEATK